MPDVTPCADEQIGDAIAHVLQHPEEGVAMGESGRRLVEERFNWDIVVEQMLQVYREVIAAKSVAAPSA